MTYCSPHSFSSAVVEQDESNCNPYDSQFLEPSLDDPCCSFSRSDLMATAAAFRRLDPSRVFCRWAGARPKTDVAEFRVSVTFQADRVFRSTFFGFRENSVVTRSQLATELDILDGSSSFLLPCLLFFRIGTGTVCDRFLTLDGLHLEDLSMIAKIFPISFELSVGFRLTGGGGLNERLVVDQADRLEVSSGPPNLTCDDARSFVREEVITVSSSAGLR